MITLSVEIPDTESAKELVSSLVVKINRAHAIAETNEKADKDRKLARLSPAKKDIPVEEKKISPALKDFSITDIRAILEANDVKIGVGNGRKPDLFYFELLSEVEGLEGMVEAYKADQLGGYN